MINWQMFLAISTITIGLLQAIVIVWEIVTIRKLIRELETIRGTFKNKFEEAIENLAPLIKALNHATPFLEVFNSITSIFRKKNKRY